jgi:mannosyltransferase
MTLQTTHWRRIYHHWLLVILITLAGLVLRLYHLGFKGLWGDEIWTAQVAVLPARQLAAQTVPMMLANFIPGPLYYWLAHGALALFGQDQAEWALRLPSALASALAVPALYGLASTLVNRRVGLMAALLLAVSPYQVWYAQEARFYAWTVLLSVVSTWALARASQEPPRPLAWLAFIAASAANLYNQPVSALTVLLAQGGFILLSLLCQPRRVRWLAAAGLSYGAVVLLYAPVLYAVFATGYYSRQPQSVAVAQRSFFSPGLDDWQAWVADILIDMNMRFTAIGPSRWLFLALALVGIGYFVWTRRFAALAMALSFLLAVLAIFAIARPATAYIARYVLFFQPIYLLCVAAGVAGLAEGLRNHRRSRQIIPGVALAALLVASLLTVAQGYREAKINDWRAIAVYLKQQAQPGAIITGNRWFGGAFSWYWRDWSYHERCSDSDPLLLDELAAGRQLWYVLIGDTESPVSAELAAALTPLAGTAWQQPGLDYAPAFFPVSEFAARILTGGAGSNASLVFCETSQAGWTDKSYREIGAGQTVHFRLTRPTDGAHSLELVYLDRPGQLLEVRINQQPGVTIGGEGDWQTVLLPVDSANAAVMVAISAIGAESGVVSSARLVAD